jgi:hypothetical protein
MGRQSTAAVGMVPARTGSPDGSSQRDLDESSTSIHTGMEVSSKRAAGTVRQTPPPLCNFGSMEPPAVSAGR